MSGPIALYRPWMVALRLFLGVAATSWTATPGHAQMLIGGYGPFLQAVHGYPWPVAVLGLPPSLPMAGVFPYSRVPPIVPQRTPVTCWAAAMSNLFLFYGYDVPQETIVKALSPTGDPTLASPEMMAAGLEDRVWTDTSGKRFRVVSQIDSLFPGHRMSAPCDNDCLFNELAAGRPLLMGTIDHAMVLYAVMKNMYGSMYMMWANDPAPMVTPFSADPMAPRPPRYLGTTGEQYGFFFAAARVTSCSSPGAGC